MCMNNKYYNILMLLFLTLSLNPYQIYADSFKISNTSDFSSFEEFTTPNTQIFKSSPDWKYVDNINGINSFKKIMPDTQSKAYKGVCIINSPIKTIYSIMTDVKNHNQWVKYCKSSKTIENNSPSSLTQYYQFDIPWPFSNRDMVVNSTADVDWDAGKVTISCVATVQPNVPQQQEFIRVRESNQKWLLEKVTPTSTKVTYTSHTPLSISESELIKEIASTTMPFSTLERLKKLSAKKYEASRTRCIVKSESDSDIKKEFKFGSYFGSYN